MQHHSLLVLAALLAACSPQSTPTPSAPVEGAGSLRLGSWNIEWLDSRRGQGHRPRTEAEFEELASVITRARVDVWTFQEVADGAAVERILGSGWQIYVEQRRADQRVAVAVRDGLSVQFAEVESIAVGRRGLRNGVTAVLPGLEVMAIHLKAGCQWDPLDRGEACETLGQQVVPVEEWLDTRRGPAVVMGDWNRQLTRDDEVWTDLTDGGRSALVAPLLDLPDACEGSRHRHPIDHMVFVGVDESAISGRQLTNPASSDHCPIVVDVQL